MSTETTTRTLVELLARWAELEPDRCGAVPPPPHLAGDYRVRVKDENSWYLVECTPGILQAAVQEAIEARGWNWRLSRKGLQADGITWQRFAEIWHPYESWRPIFVMRTETPAHTLLDAYVQTLEAGRR